MGAGGTMAVCHWDSEVAHGAVSVVGCLQSPRYPEALSWGMRAWSSSPPGVLHGGTEGRPASREGWGRDRSWGGEELLVLAPTSQAGVPSLPLLFQALFLEGL